MDPAHQTDPSFLPVQGGDRFRWIRLIGQGSHGEVWLAEDRSQDGHVAVKVFCGNDALRERSQNEDLGIPTLSHPHLVRVFEVVECEQSTLLVMEHVSGKTLQNWLRRGRLAVDLATELTVQIAQGLNHIHDRGILHCDVKPANILVAKGPLAKLTDFGCAERWSPGTEATPHSNVVGTRPYLSPEQISGQAIDPRADLYSLGVIFYEMLTGQRPFQGTDEEIQEQILTQAPPAPHRLHRDIPRATSEVCLRAISKNRDHRYESARDLAQALESSRTRSGFMGLWKLFSTRR
ncbi:MAG: serine/threonine protein kinase [Planctomycetaceae bacterium]|nr:serine/threonine protein kinase [Planctomycetaceae bacterium]